MSHHEIDKLSCDEISYLKNIPIQTVHQTLEESLQKLRTYALETIREENPEYTKIFDYVKTNRVCCVCESIIQEIPIRVYGSVGLYYCSIECQEEQPPDIIVLQQRFGLPIEKILRWVITSFRKPLIAAQSLGVSITRFRHLCRQYLKIDVNKYYNKGMNSLIINIQDNLNIFEKKAKDQYGNNSLDFMPIKEMLKEL